MLPNYVKYLEEKFSFLRLIYIEWKYYTTRVIYYYDNFGFKIKTKLRFKEKLMLRFKEKYMKYLEKKFHFLRFIYIEWKYYITRVIYYYDNLEILD